MSAKGAEQTLATLFVLLDIFPIERVIILIPFQQQSNQKIHKFYGLVVLYC